MATRKVTNESLPLEPERAGDDITITFALAADCTVEDVKGHRSSIAEDGTVTTSATIHVTASLSESADLDGLPDAEAVRAKLKFHQDQPALKKNQGGSWFKLSIRPLKVTLAKDARVANFTGNLIGRQSYAYAGATLKGLRLVVDANLDGDAWEAMRGLLKVKGVSLVIADPQALRAVDGGRRAAR